MCCCCCCCHFLGSFWCYWVPSYAGFGLMSRRPIKQTLSCSMVVELLRLRMGVKRTCWPCMYAKNQQESERFVLLPHHQVERQNQPKTRAFVVWDANKLYLVPPLGVFFALSLRRKTPKRKLSHCQSPLSVRKGGFNSICFWLDNSMLYISNNTVR